MRGCERQGVLPTLGDLPDADCNGYSNRHRHRNPGGYGNSYGESGGNRHDHGNADLHCHGDADYDSYQHGNDHADTAANAGAMRRVAIVLTVLLGCWTMRAEATGPTATPTPAPFVGWYNTVLGDALATYPPVNPLASSVFAGDSATGCIDWNPGGVWTPVPNCLPTPPPGGFSGGTQAFQTTDTTDYFPVLGQAAISTTESTEELVAPATHTYTAISCALATASAAGTTFAFSFLDATSACGSAITCTVTATATTCNNSGSLGSCVVTFGDLIVFNLVTGIHNPTASAGGCAVQ